ncbi:hypothetical protein D3C75_756790 [compost metagenome]
MINVDAVQSNFSPVHIIEAHQQIDQRGFPCSGLADDGYPGAGLHCQAEVGDQRAHRIVGKGHMAEFHRPLGRLRRYGICRLRFFPGHIHNGENPLGGGRSRLQLGQHAGNFIEGFGEQVGINQEAGQASNRNLRHDAGNAPHHGNHRKGHIVHQPGSGVGQGPQELGLHTGFVQAAVLFLELLHGPGFIVKCLDDLLAAYHFLHITVQLTQSFGLLPEQLLRAGGDITGGIIRRGSGQKHNQRHQRADKEHQHNRANDSHDSREQRGKALLQPVGDHIHIVDEAADAVSVGMVVMKGQGQLTDMPEQILAEGVYGFVGRLVHQVGKEPAEQAACPVDNTQYKQNVEHSGEIHLSRSRHGIYCFPDVIRACQT